MQVHDSYIFSSCAKKTSRLGIWAGGDQRQSRGCDLQHEHQTSHSGGVFNRNMRSIWNGKYGGLSDIYQSTVHGARPTQNLRPPGGDHPAAQRTCPSLRTRSRARRGPRMHHPGRLGERGGAGRGRTGPGAANPERARSAYS
jgi:hypothetical protein